MHLKKKILLVFTFLGILPPIFKQTVELAKGGFTSENPFVEFLWNIVMYSFVGFVYSFILSWASLTIVGFLEKKLPWQHGVTKRLLAEIFLIIPCNTVLTIIIASWEYTWVCPEKIDNLYGEILISLVITWSMTLLLMAIYEGVFLFNEWKKSLLRAEKLEKENLQSQYEFLKKQINPHFLFNSLNVLSSLIHSDIGKAEKFIDEFARVYRYVLEVQDKNLVSLAQELDFLKSFLFLQKIRFDKNLSTHIRIEAKNLQDFLPPLSLQLLVENAIKHNIISQRNPLNIEIYNQNGSLLVKNNLQQRQGNEHSTNIGQRNLTERYHFLHQETPEFYIENQNYIAKIPLIKSEN